VTYEELKAKHPDWNWDEAEEQDNDNLDAAADLFDSIKNGEYYKQNFKL
jgi:hypothetical protein